MVSDSEQDAKPEVDVKSTGAENGGAGGDSSVLRTMRFRRGRASKACEICHARKVRCDMTENFPCTNCKAFVLKCVPREGRAKHRKGAAVGAGTGEVATANGDAGLATSHASTGDHAAVSNADTARDSLGLSTSPGAPGSLASGGVGAAATSSGVGSHKETTSPAGYAGYGLTVGAGGVPGAGAETVTETGAGSSAASGSSPTSVNGMLRVHGALVSADVPLATVERTAVPVRTGKANSSIVFLGSTSHLVHLTPANFDESERKPMKLDEISDERSTLLPYTEATEAALRIQGAFLLPSPEVSDHLIDHYFEYIHPYLPVLDRMAFMRAYRQDRDKPSLFLRQAMFSVASRGSTHPALLDKSGTTRKATLSFYMRAKLLYEAEYEEDPYNLVAGAALLGLPIDHPFYVNHNVYYWTRIAVTLAQGIGMHRRVQNTSRVSLEDQRRQRRMWWALFTRDIASSMAYGRPTIINLEDCDIDMVSLQDFIGVEAPTLPAGSTARQRVLYFIHNVRLHEIIGLIMRVQYTVGAERLQRLHFLPDVSQCDQALADWVTRLPPELGYSIKDPSRHGFLRALLYLQYYTVVCLAHRPQVAHLFKASSANGSRGYPAWGFAFQAAHMIVKILENLERADELRALPGTVVYTCFSADIILSYQRRSSSPEVAAAAEQSMESLLRAIRELSKSHATAAWLLRLHHEIVHGRIGGRIAPALLSSTASSSATKREREDNDGDEPVEQRRRTALKLATELSPDRVDKDDSVSPNQPLQQRQQQQVSGNTGGDRPRQPNQQLRSESQPRSLSLQDTLGDRIEPGLEPDGSGSASIDGQEEDDLGLPLLDETPPLVSAFGTPLSTNLFPLNGSTLDLTENQAMPGGGTDGAPPDTLNMTDWYDFLMTLPNMEPIA